MTKIIIQSIFIVGNIALIAMPAHAQTWQSQNQDSSTAYIQQDIQNNQMQQMQEQGQKLQEEFNHSEVVYTDGNVALFRVPHKSNGDPTYRAAKVSTRSSSFQFSDKETYTGAITRIFTQEQFDALTDARRAAVEKDSEAYDRFPEGPFTNAISNVVGGASVDKKYVGYLRDLMKSMGLGNVRVFMFHGKDVNGNPKGLHLNGPYASVLARANPKDSAYGVKK